MTVVQTVLLWKYMYVCMLHTLYMHIAAQIWVEPSISVYCLMYMYKYVHIDKECTAHNANKTFTHIIWEQIEWLWRQSSWRGHRSCWPAERVVLAPALASGTKGQRCDQPSSHAHWQQCRGTAPAIKNQDKYMYNINDDYGNEKVLHTCTCT